MSRRKRSTRGLKGGPKEARNNVYGTRAYGRSDTVAPINPIHLSKPPTPSPTTYARPELFLIDRDLLFAVDGTTFSAMYQELVSLDLAHLPYHLTDIGVPGDIIAHMERSPFGQPNKSNSVRIRTILPSMDIDPPQDEWKPKFTTPMHPEAAAISIGTKVPIEKSIEEIAASLGNPYHDWQLFVRYHNELPYNIYLIDPQGHKIDTGPPITSRTNHTMGVAENLRRMLIVLLSTKQGVISDRKLNKLASLGIGKNRRKKSNRPLYTTTLRLNPEYKGRPLIDSAGIPKRPHPRRGHMRNQRFGPRNQFVRRIWIEECYIHPPASPPTGGGSPQSDRTAYNVS